MVDFYAVLEVEPHATLDEIRTAFKQKALKYHPDKNKMHEDTRDMFERVHLAYNVLKDPESRKKYDDTFLRKEGQSTDSNMDELVNIFMDMMMQQMQSLKRGAKKTSDLVLSVNIKLEDVYHGDIKKIIARVKRNEEWKKQVFYLNLLEYQETYVFKGQADNYSGDVIVNTHIVLPNEFITVNGRDIHMKHGIDLFTILYGGTVVIPYMQDDNICLEVKPFTFKYTVKDHGLPCKTRNNREDVIYGDLVVELFLDVDINVLSLQHVYEFIKTYFKK